MKGVFPNILVWYSQFG